MVSPDDDFVNLTGAVQGAETAQLPLHRVTKAVQTQASRRTWSPRTLKCFQMLLSNFGFAPGL